MLDVRAESWAIDASSPEIASVSQQAFKMFQYILLCSEISATWLQNLEASEPPAV